MQRTLLLVVSLLVILALFLGFGFLKSRYTATVTDTVLKTERVQYCSRTCSSKYLVFGQHETYEDTDSIWFLKFNSSDLYGHLQRRTTVHALPTGQEMNTT
jgi:hypothetical protein